MNEIFCLELRIKTEIDHINIICMINVYDEKRQLIISIQKQNTIQTETETQKINTLPQHKSRNVLQQSIRIA